MPPKLSIPQPRNAASTRPTREPVLATTFLALPTIFAQGVLSLRITAVTHCGGLGFAASVRCSAPCAVYARYSHVKCENACGSPSPLLPCPCVPAGASTACKGDRRGEGSLVYVRWAARKLEMEGQLEGTGVFLPLISGQLPPAVVSPPHLFCPWCNNHAV